MARYYNGMTLNSSLSTRFSKLFSGVALYFPSIQGHERNEAMKRVDKLNEHIRSSEQALEEQRRLRAELQVRRRNYPQNNFRRVTV